MASKKSSGSVIKALVLGLASKKSSGFVIGKQASKGKRSTKRGKEAPKGGQKHQKKKREHQKGREVPKEEETHQKGKRCNKTGRVAPVSKTGGGGSVTAETAFGMQPF